MAIRETNGPVHVSGSAAEGLSDRQREILTAIIEVYIETAEPVGSRTLTKRKKLQVSPATVRNAMADLEELGLLSAPHASAGRVPTASGFRVYIERLAARGRITGKDRELIQAIVRGEGDQSSLRTVLEVAGRVLSSVSKHAALVLMPSLEDVVFEHIEFVPVRERSILTIFVIDGQIVGVFGCVLGITVGLTLCQVLNQYGLKLDPRVYYLEKLPVVVKPIELLIVAIGTLILSTVATLFPAIKAARTKPVDGLTQRQAIKRPNQKPPRQT